jgi:type I restriction enzyme S subunit
MSWHECTLGDVIKLQRGHDLPERVRVDGPFPIVSSSGITGRHNVAKAAPPGVVTGRYGTIGEVFFVDEPYWPLNTALYVVDFKGNDPRFTAYLLRNLLKNYKSEKAAVPGVDRNVLHLLKVRTTQRRQQERIVSILAAYDELIENNRRRIALLEEAVRLLYREWFVHFRFPGHEHVKIIDGLPEGWEHGTIGNVFATSSGGTPSRQKSEYFEGAINWIKTQEMNNGFIFDTDEKITREALQNSSAKLFPENTVLVAMYGATIGQLCILANASSCNQACCALLPKLDKKDYLFAYCFMDRNRVALKDRGQGSAQTNISQQVIRDFPITIPKRSLLSLFYENVEPIFAQRRTLEAQNASLSKGRDLLLPRLMNGEIAV